MYQLGCAVEEIALQLKEMGMCEFLCEEKENSTYSQIKVISGDIFGNC